MIIDLLKTASREFAPRTAAHDALESTNGGKRLEDPNVSLSDPEFLAALGGMPQPSGVRVTEKSAFKNITLATCIKIKAETLAGLPFGVHRVQGKTCHALPRHHVRRLLQGMPNPEMNAHTFKMTLTAHLQSWGACYAEKEFDSAGRLKHLWPIPPHLGRFERIGKKKVFIVLINGEPKAIDPDRIFHVYWWTWNGLRPISPIRMVARAVGLTDALEIFASNFFGHGNFLSGFVTHPLSLKPETKGKIARSLEHLHNGLDRSHRFSILDEGMDFKEFRFPLEEAQLLQSRAFQSSQLAAYMGMTPDRINVFEKAATYASLDATETRHVKSAIVPECQRWESAVDQQLLHRWQGDQWRHNPLHPDEEMEPELEDDLYSRFDISDVLRGDPEVRARIQTMKRLAGIWNADEIRAQDDENPQGGRQGRTYLVPENLRPAHLPLPDQRVGSAHTEAAVNLPGTVDFPLLEAEILSLNLQSGGGVGLGSSAIGPNPSPSPGNVNHNAAQRSLGRSLEAAFQRLQSREQKALARVRQKTGDDYGAAAHWYKTRLSETFVAQTLETPFLAYAELLINVTESKQEQIRQYAIQRAKAYIQAAARRARRGEETSTVEHLVAQETQAIHRLLKGM